MYHDHLISQITDVLKLLRHLVQVKVQFVDSLSLSEQGRHLTVEPLVLNKFEVVTDDS